MVGGFVHLWMFGLFGEGKDTAELDHVEGLIETDLSLKALLVVFFY